MSLTTLNAQAVALLQNGRPDEGVSLLLEAFDRLDLLNGNEVAASASGEEEESLGPSDSSGSKSSQIRSSCSTRYSVESRSQYSKEASSLSRNEAGRYKTAISRATEAHLRLSHSRSLEATNTNESESPLLSSVGSDVSALSEATGNDDYVIGAAVLPSRSDVSDEGEATMTAGISSTDASESPEEQEEAAVASIPQPSSPAAVLKSVELPKFHHLTTEEESALPVSDNIFTFYQRAFVLPAEDDGDSNLEVEAAIETRCPKQSAVLFFNMGVAHHNYAMTSSRHDRVASHREVRTALLFYDLCFNIIQHSWADDEDFLLLLLAVWNNMGHIHAHRYNYLETQEMLTSLQEILQVISGSPLLDNPDFWFFYKNLVVYEEQEFAAAPAA